MWWGIVNLGTVGYGDIYPVTPWGKFIGSMVVILGIGLFALPAGILASGLAEVLAKRKEQKMVGMVCPHCGRCIDEEHMKS
jgi:voltage-gated potassium channel